MIAAQTSLAIAAVEKDLAGDRRRIVIAGRQSEFDTLKAEAPDLWKDPPACFNQAVAVEMFQIIGSFDGTPCGVSHDRECPTGLAFFFDGDMIGGVVTETVTGHPHSYHSNKGDSIIHPLAGIASEVENKIARDVAGMHLYALTDALSVAFRNQQLCVTLLLFKIGAEKIAALKSDTGKAHLLAIIDQAFSEPDSPEYIAAVNAQASTWGKLAAADLAQPA